MNKNLFYCVSAVQLDREDYSSSSTQKYLQYAIWAYKYLLKFSVAQSVDVFYGTPNAVGIIQLPDDFEYYTKVAIQLGGRYVTLTLNPDLPWNNRTNGCGDDVNDNLYGEIPSTTALLDAAYSTYGYGYTFAPHFRNGNYVGEMYGIGGGISPAGTFNIDYKLSQIQLSNIPLAPIVVEYVSNQVSGATLISDVSADLIVWYIHKRLASLGDVPEVKYRRICANFNDALDKFKMMQTLPTMDEYLDGCYKSTKSSPKR